MVAFKRISRVRAILAYLIQQTTARLILRAALTFGARVLTDVCEPLDKPTARYAQETYQHHKQPDGVQPAGVR